MPNPTITIPPKNFWPTRVMLFLIVLGGLALRLYRLGQQSLWYDETVSAFLAGQSIPDLIAHTARDIHPPGYYLLLHVWTVLAGNNEFSLAFFSVICGLLIIPLTYVLAYWLTNRPVALWSALLVTVSPFNIWYSQEVRMYTLGAALGLVAAYTLIKGTETDRLQLWLGYVIVAAVGLYTLYYFAFLLITINGFILLRQLITQRLLKNGLIANIYVVLAYALWVPTAWRQATNPPVPPWRSLPQLGQTLLESWTALSLGQSVEPSVVWPILLLTLGLTGLGLIYLRSLDTRLPAGSFLIAYTFGPLLLIYLISFIAPLYHVRYLFTYAAAFYILLGAGLVWLAQRAMMWAAGAVAAILVVASFYSIYQFHVNPAYRADDFRAAVDFIDQHWQPGDVILINAGYTYPAFLYYTDHRSDLQSRRLVPYQSPDGCCSPLLLQTGAVDGPAQLGWGDPESDFYAMTAAETIAALEQVSQDFSRLWLLRAYDTVTDPNGLIRAWLAENATPIEDQPFSGESNIRAQGFLLASSTVPQGPIVALEDGLLLAGSAWPQQPWRAGQIIPVKLWWSATGPPSADYKASLKLWTSDGQLAAQGRDEWPGGTLHRATTWVPDEIIYHPMHLTLPPDLPAGQYWLNVELYHPETIQPLHQLPNGETAIALGPITVEEK
ncbi:MAG: glycosyltransferase family 39 protein [Anaerolineaceae bacterium]|nr:glycosyltransferase family 39 protein [Anaerolineaceae bacterium]